MVSGNKKLAILFAGQGAQSPGMGKSLYDCSAAARDIFDSAGDELKSLIFKGSADELKDTRVTQPSVYTVDMAAWAAFSEATELAGIYIKSQRCGMIVQDSIGIVGMAGFSLGEYAAMTAAGILPSFEEGLDLVRKRSEFMSMAGRYEDGSPRGAMAAVLGKREDVLDIVKMAQGNYVLEAVNFNSPSQTVIAGDAVGIKAFQDKVKQSGKKMRAIPLPVSTAFHTSIMDPASEGIREAATAIKFGEAGYDLCLNLTGRYIAGSDGNIPDIMSKQVRNPVYWQECLETLKASGADTFIELGPGKTLSALVKKTIPGAEIYNIEDEESLNNTISALKNNIN